MCNLPCTRQPTITLADQRNVCNYCPSYQAECLEREQLARTLLTKKDARQQLETMDNNGQDTTRLRAVMNRIRNANNR